MKPLEPDFYTDGLHSALDMSGNGRLLPETSVL